MQEQALVPFQTASLPSGPWLVFAPHPDDETFGMGGTLLLAREAGIEVTLVIMTDGALGGEGDPELLAQTREKEVQEVAAHLHITRLIFWREPDRGLEINARLVARAREAIEQTQPATIFFPSPTEFHPDHRAAAGIVWQAVGESGYSGKRYSYEISVEGRINRLHDITAKAREKMSLIELYRSQLQANDYLEKIMALNRARTYSLPADIQYAEGFYEYDEREGDYVDAIIRSLSIYWQGMEGIVSQSQKASGQKPALSEDNQTIEKAPPVGLISVIVRTKDRPELLREALDSIAAQTYPEIELIVVNDGGKDVAEEVGEYEGKVNQLQYISLQPGEGRSAAANAGLDAATGGFLAFLDDDDWWLPEHLSLLAQVLAARQERAVYSGVRCVGMNTGEAKEKYVYNEPYNKLKLHCKNFLPIHAVLFERSLIEEGCRFDERFDLYEDWDFWLQVAQKTDFFHVDAVTAFYRIGQGSGLGVDIDQGRKQEALKTLYEKWRQIWPLEDLIQLIQYAQQGIEYPHTRRYIRDLQRMLAEKDRILALRQDHVENLEQHRKELQAHIDNLENHYQAAIQHGREMERLYDLTKNHAANLEDQLKATQDHAENLEDQLKSTRIHAENLEDRLKSTQKHAGNLEECLQNVSNELEITRQLHAASEAHAENLQQIVKRKDRELRKGKEHIRNLNAMLEIRQKEAEHWRGQYAGVVGSTTWKLAMPLRMMGNAYKFTKYLFRRRYHEPRLVPVHQLESRGEGRFVALGSDPHFQLEFRQDKCPTRWVEVRARLRGDSVSKPEIYYDTGDDFNEQHKFPLIREGGDMYRALARVPDFVQEWRLDPLHEEGEFEVAELSVIELGTLEVSLRLLAPRLWRLLRSPRKWPSRIRWLRNNLKCHGWHGTKQLLAFQALRHAQPTGYNVWYQQYGMLTEAERKRIHSHLDSMDDMPLISIVMPVFNPPEKWLRKAIDSVIGQLYPNWELCIADDNSTAPHVRKVLEEYQRRDARIKVVYRTANGHISKASNSALELAQGEYIALMDHDDQLAEHALYMVAAAIEEHPEAGVLYSDEDKIDEEGHHFDPYFKPDWNPMLLLGQNYLNHLTVYRADLVRGAGGFRVGVEGCQDWDLALQITARLNPQRIVHIPFVLYHWRAVEGSTATNIGEKGYAAEVAVKVVRRHLERVGRPATVKGMSNGHCRIKFSLVNPPPKVSLIIPTRDGYELLYRCIETLVAETDYPDYEVIVVDNGSEDPQTLDYLASLEERAGFRVLRYDAPFNFSAINNFAAERASGEILGFLNNDLEILEADWLTEMVSHAVHPENGAVGAMLYYPDDRIQHAGVILGIGGVAGHAYTGFPRGYPGQMGRALLTQNMTAVTAACLLVRKAIFDEVGGFDARHLAVAFNDVDLCLKLHGKGYRNVWTPLAELYHHESASRGYEDTPEKLARFNKEIDVMKRRWGGLLENDPAYNPNLTLGSLDFSLAFPPRARKPWEAADDGGEIQRSPDVKAATG